MKKSILLTIISLLLLLCSVFFLTACKSSDSNQPQLQDDQTYKIDFSTVYAFAEEAGFTGTMEDLIAAFKGEKGDKGDKGDAGTKGETGAPGNGIVKVEKTASSGLVDTYTITFTDGSTFDFTVTNGRDGTSNETTVIDPNVPTPNDYFRFKLLEDDTYEVSARYIDMPSRVVIPGNYEGKPVTQIASDGFGARLSVDEVVIPKEIVTISDYAFGACQELNSVIFEENSRARTIGSHAFYECKNLRSIWLPDSIEEIGESAFDAFFENGGLTSIRLPNPDVVIGERAFYVYDVHTHLNINTVYYGNTPYTFSETPPTSEGNYFFFDYLCRIVIWTDDPLANEANAWGVDKDKLAGLYEIIETALDTWSDSHRQFAKPYKDESSALASDLYQTLSSCHNNGLPWGTASTYVTATLSGDGYDVTVRWGQMWDSLYTPEKTFRVDIIFLALSPAEVLKVGYYTKNDSLTSGFADELWDKWDEHGDLSFLDSWMQGQQITFDWTWTVHLDSGETLDLLILGDVYMDGDSQKMAVNDLKVLIDSHEQEDKLLLELRYDTEYDEYVFFFDNTKERFYASQSTVFNIFGTILEDATEVYVESAHSYFAGTVDGKQVTVTVIDLHSVAELITQRIRDLGIDLTIEGLDTLKGCIAYAAIFDDSDHFIGSELALNIPSFDLVINLNGNQTSYAIGDTYIYITMQPLNISQKTDDPESLDDDSESLDNALVGFTA